MSLVSSLFACVRARRGRAAGDSAPDDVGLNAPGSPARQQHQQQQQHHHQILQQSSSSRVKFGVPLAEVCRAAGGALPAPLLDLLVHVARHGVTVNDLFRRPGNPGDMKRIIKCLGEGRPVDWRDYNYWTAANVAKKFLLAIPDGVFGRDGEAALLAAMDQPDRLARLRAMREVIRSLPPPIRQLNSLLFGTWNRMCSATPDADGVPVEAVAKSVAGSMFHSCTDDPKKVEHASKVMELLISGFTNPELFGEDLIRYFAAATSTPIRLDESPALDASSTCDYSSSEHTKRYFRAHKPTPASSASSAAMQQRPHRRHHPPQLSPPSSDAVSVHSTLSDITGLQLPAVESPSISADIVLHRAVARTEPAACSTRQQAGDEAQQARSISWRRTSEGADLLPENLLDVPGAVRQTLQSSEAASERQQSQHRRTPSSRFNSVRRRQLERLARRTRWFLASATAADAADDSEIAECGAGLSAASAGLQQQQQQKKKQQQQASIELQFSATSGPDLLESAGRPADSDDADWLLVYKPD